jgi:hypothetical protein
MNKIESCFLAVHDEFKEMCIELEKIMDSNSQVEQARAQELSEKIVCLK